MRHPLLSLLLALVLLSPAALSWMGTAWQRHAIREGVEAQLRQGVDAAGLTILAFTVKEAGRLLEWEHPQEFEYAGEMYDVVEQAVHGDSVIYTCYHDRAETALNRQLHQWLAHWLQHSPLQQEQNERLLCFFRSLFCTSGAALDSAAPAKEEQLFAYQMPAGLAKAPLPPPPPEPC